MTCVYHITYLWRIKPLLEQRHGDRYLVLDKTSIVWTCWCVGLVVVFGKTMPYL